MHRILTKVKSSTGVCFLFTFCPVFDLYSIQPFKVFEVISYQDQFIFNGCCSNHEVELIMYRLPDFTKADFFFCITPDTTENRNDIERPLRNKSTALWDFAGLSLFSAPYLSSAIVISEIKQFSLPFSFICSSRFNLPRRKNTQMLVSSKYFIRT